MKNYYFLCSLFILVVIKDLQSQISVQSENNIQLNEVDSILNGKNIMIDRNGKIHLSVGNQNLKPELNKPMSLSVDYLNYGSQYEGAFFFKHNNRVQLGGLIRKVTGTLHIEDGDIITILPKEYRPTKNIYPRATQNGNTVTMIIDINGEVSVYKGGDSTHDFLSLDGISFYRSIEIGDYIDGGYVFYIADPLEDLDGDGDLDKGLIAAGIHTGAGTWGCDGISGGAEEIAIGKGYQNCTSAIDACSFQNEVINYCDEFVLNGFDDWFLPSHEEIKLIWENLVDPDGNGMNDGDSIGNFISGNYWSSTEASFDNEYILTISLSSGFPNLAVPKTQSLFFRAIRVLDN